jgi:DNA-binding beta-propeller fold protein YncE
MPRKAMLLFIGLFVFCSVFVYIVQANAQETRWERYELVTKWGSRGSANGQFQSPRGIAVDSSGNVYVADSGNHRVQKFSSDGAYVTKWGSEGFGDGQFHGASGLAVDSSRNVYVSDAVIHGGGHRVLKFTDTGRMIGWWGQDGRGYTGWHEPGSGRTGLSGTGDGQFNGPTHVAVDAMGNVYVTDLENHRVQKFSSSGIFITKWGSQGSGDGQFNWPSGISVDSSGNIYVADNGNHRVQKFSSDGAYITKWGSEGSGDGQFSGSTGIAVGPSGNVYVVDFRNCRFQKFDPNGRFLGKWGSRGSGDGQFNDPIFIAVDSSENVYVSDFRNDRVQKFRLTAAGGEVVITTTTISRIAAVMSTATLPPQYIISVHEGGNSEGILQIVHDDNSEGLMSKMSAVVPAPGAALGAPIEDARVRVGGDPFITTDSNGRTPAFVAKERDSISITKRGYKSLRITIPLKKYADRFSGIVVQLKRQLGPAAPLSVPAPSIRTPVGP